MRYRGAWLAAGWVQVLVVVVLGVIPAPAALSPGADWVGHFLQYVVLTVWFGGVVGADRHIHVVVGLILLGMTIEVAQAMNIFRHFDLRDIAMNVFGVLAGLLLVRTLLRDWCQRIEAYLHRSRV